LRDYLIIEIKRIIPGAILNGSQRERLPNNINFSFPGQDGEQLVLRLDARGIAVSSGAACSARERSTSYVVAALGGAGAASALRMTLGRETTKSDVDYLIKNLSALVVKSK
jgi:cysteine desulfurase